jgi:hypothetical protein
MVAVNSYSQERLARLLRLLRPAPPAWIGRTQRTLLEMLTHDRSADVGSGLTEAELTDLARALELDPLFRRSFDEDPVAAAEAAGWPTLARNIERDIAQLVAVAERITTDASYREELLEDPLVRLEKSGMPALAGEQLLQSLGGPDDVLARLPEVVAHRQDDASTHSRLLILILGSAAVGAMLRDLTAIQRRTAS